MSLTDFFTLTEVKNGLSTLTRVQELVSVMQKQKDCVLNLAVDASQWSSVVETLAVTENGDCLNHFVQLNGPSFLNQWLQECHKCDKDVSENLVEGLMIALLAALEKLPLDREKLIFSGVGDTVEGLLDHRNLNIKETAKKLSDKWDYRRSISCHQREDDATSLTNLPKPVAEANTTEEVRSTNRLSSVSPGRGTGDATCEVDTSCAKSQYFNGTRESNSSHLDTPTKDVENSVSEPPIPTTLYRSASAGLGEMDALASSHISSSCPENSSVKEQPSVGPAIRESLLSPRGRVEDQPVNSVHREASVGAEQMELEVNTKEDSPCKSGREESCSGSSSSDLSASSPCSSVEDLGATGANIMSPSGSSRAEADDQNPEMGLEYEEIDALDLARQVALEVEREVVDYREPFCSSPEVSSGDALDTHNCLEGKQNKPLTAAKDSLDDAFSPENQKTSVPEKSFPDLQEREQPVALPKVTSVAHGTAPKLEKNTLDFDLNDVCAEELVCSTDPIPSTQSNLSAPKAVVATPRGVPSLPITALQIKGEIGWKGSAATSAFRPAASCRTPDCIVTSPSPIQKQNFLDFDLNMADIGNDVGMDPVLVKQMPLSPNLPSVESSVEVSSRRAERLKLDLNLNRTEEEDMSTNRSSYRKFQRQNGCQSLSSASSSSSRQPSMRDFDLNDNPCFMDAGGSHNLDNSSSKASTTTYRSSKVNDPAITIMGSRIAVQRKDYQNQAHESFMGNGQHMEAMMNARPVMPYAHMPTVYAYNGHPGPNMPIHASYYGPGGIPYMVDPRGTAFIPHMLGPTGLNGVHYARPPFVMSVTGAPSHSGMNGVMPSRSGWDSNSGFAPMESGSREGGSFRQHFMHRHNGVIEESFKQPFMHGHTGLMDEQTRISSQSSSPSISVKRKEPDCGWEPFTLGYLTSRQ